MSVIRKKPFIEYLIDDLTAEQKQSLLDAVNGSGNTVNASFSNMPALAITPVLFQFDANDSKTGILIQSTSYRVLICYHRFQDLLMFKFDAQNNYQKINEYLDINELRRLLEEVNDHIVASEIDSGLASADQVLAADGDGGAEWKNVTDTITESTVTEGDAVKLFGFDSQGNLVADDLPEGILVDETIIEDSPNAVAGGAVYDLKEDVEANAAALETKANVDGNYPTMTVGVADQLSPYDDESGDDQDEPFSFQATGTGNGTQPDFSTGSIALMKEKQGNTVVVNQLSQVHASGSTVVGGITITYDGNGKINYNGTAGEDLFFDICADFNTIAGHKYLALVSPSVEGAYNTFKFSAGSDQTFEHTKSFIWTQSTSSNTSDVTIFIVSGATVNVDVYSYVIDLTQWFNGDIPADLLSHPENFFRYYQGDLSYNTGELVNANGRYVKCIGRQQWDEETELGYWDALSGEPSSGITTELRGKNYYKVIPGATYYIMTPYGGGSFVYFDANKNYIGYQFFNGNGYQFTIPANVCYMKFNLGSSYGTTYNHDITISLYYSGESGYDQYYSYEVLTNNDTGTEVLRSAGNVHDIKLPDGTIKRNVGYVDLDSLTWTYNSSDHYWSAALSTNNAKKPSSYNTKPNIICDKYSCNSWNGMLDAGEGISIAPVEEYSIIGVVNGSSTTEPTGTLYYELDEPTTEQGTQYSENLVIDDFGTMDFSGTNGVPQGNLIFYPVDYKAFIDTLYDYTEGTPSELALKSDLAGLVAQEDLSSQITDVAGLTYDVKKCYKTGNVINLSILATTTSNLSVSDELFTISSSAGVGLVNMFLTMIVEHLNVQSNETAFIRTNSVKTLKELSSGDIICINASFIIA